MLILNYAYSENISKQLTLAGKSTKHDRFTQSVVSFFLWFEQLIHCFQNVKTIISFLQNEKSICARKLNNINQGHIIRILLHTKN